MTTHTIFYSWQSDLANATNRGFIEDCLSRAIKDVKADEELELDPCLDRDTAGVPGSPDIANTIFEKIRRADIFVGDVSFINGETPGRRTPNPNVLVELGFAACCLGWDRIICVFNRVTGEINDLPFDIRQRRVRGYDLRDGQEKADQRKILVAVLKGDITDILHAPDKIEAEKLQELLSALASELIEVLIAGNELEERSINPWLAGIRGQFQQSATSLQHLAATDVAIRHGMHTELDGLATTLDEAASLRWHMGIWPQWSGLVVRAVEQANAIKRARTDSVSLPEEALAQARETMITTQRKLAGLATRAEEMCRQGRIADLKRDASGYGYTLLRVGHFDIDGLQNGLSERTRQIGRELHLVETMPVYLDGGVTVGAIVDRVKSASQALTELVQKL